MKMSALKVHFYKALAGYCASTDHLPPQLDLENSPECYMFLEAKKPKTTIKCSLFVKTASTRNVASKCSKTVTHFQPSQSQSSEKTPGLPERWFQAVSRIMYDFLT